MQRFTSSPWGAPDYQREIAPGLFIVSTPSHGGFFLSAERNAQVPAAWRAASFNGQGKAGWYEEDCDAVLVVLAHPHVFTPADVERAEAAFATWFAPKGLVYAAPRVQVEG